jgi:hypothetical protein
VVEATRDIPHIQASARGPGGTFPGPYGAGNMAHRMTSSASHRRTPLLIAAAALLAAAVAMATGQEGRVVPMPAQLLIRAGAPATLAKVEVPDGVQPVEAVEVTVRPAKLPEEGSLLLQVELFDAAELGRSGPSAATLASGTVAFFPRAKVGELQSFIVPIAPGQRERIAQRRPLSARVSVMPANSERKLGETAIELVGARLR